MSCTFSILGSRSQAGGDQLVQLAAGQAGGGDRQVVVDDDGFVLGRGVAGRGEEHHDADTGGDGGGLGSEVSGLGNVSAGSRTGVGEVVFARQRQRVLAQPQCCLAGGGLG